MKYILLLRHAKSSRQNSGLNDFDRPLAKQGQKDARQMGKFLKQSGYLPETIISSPAVRARQTVELLAKSGSLDEQAIRWNEDFYHGSSHDYLEAIQQFDERLQTILLVGHNPKMENTVNLLCSRGRHGIVRMPPAALVCVEHPAIKWPQIIEGTARLKWMTTPELLDGLLG